MGFCTNHKTSSNSVQIKQFRKVILVLAAWCIQHALTDSSVEQQLFGTLRLKQGLSFWFEIIVGYWCFFHGNISIQELCSCLILLQSTEGNYWCFMMIQENPEHFYRCLGEVSCHFLNQSLFASLAPPGDLPELEPRKLFTQGLREEWEICLYLKTLNYESSGCFVQSPAIYTKDRH